MANNKKNNSTTKKSTRFMKVYAVACSISLIIGLLSFGAAKKASQSALEMNRQTIKIPSFEAVTETYEEKPAPTAAPMETPKEEVKKEAYKEAAAEKQEYTDVKTVSTEITEEEKELSFILPCEGTLLKKFSADKPLKSKTMGDFRIHNGCDIKCTVGDSVYAAADGVIENIYEDNLLGTTIIISHDENLKTEYSNMAGGNMVNVGQTVKSGDCIGCVGDTAKGELLDDAHLHFAVVKDGNYVNPEDYVSILKQGER